MRHAWNPKGCTQSKSMSGQHIAFRDVARKISVTSGPSELAAARRWAEWGFLSVTGSDSLGTRLSLGTVSQCLKSVLWVSQVLAPVPTSPLSSQWPWKCRSITISLSFSCSKFSLMNYWKASRQSLIDHTLHPAPHDWDMFHRWAWCQQKCAYQDFVLFIKLMHLRQAES